MILVVASETDAFIRRKCEACKRQVRPGQAVFTRFDSKRPYGQSWFLLHLRCVKAPSESVTHAISSLATDMEVDAGAVAPERAEYFELREQIIQTKEAFPHAAA